MYVSIMVKLEVKDANSDNVHAVTLYQEKRHADYGHSVDREYLNTILHQVQKQNPDLPKDRMFITVNTRENFY